MDEIKSIPGNAYVLERLLGLVLVPLGVLGVASQQWSSAECCWR